MSHNLLKNVRVFYEGDSTVVVEPPVTTPVAPPTKVEGMVPQDQVNRLLKISEDKAKAQITKYISELETIKQNVNLSEQERTNLQARIDELTSQNQTAEQKATSEIQKLQKKYDTDLPAEQLKSKTWQSRYERKLITVDIQNAAAKYNAANPEQIEAYLAPRTKTVEELGEDNKPTGEFTTRVDFMGKDKEGKPTLLKLSVDDAVKAMTEMDEHLNLFRNPATGGVGQMPNGNGPTGSRLPDMTSMSPADYAKNRKAIRAEMAKTK